MLDLLQRAVVRIMYNHLLPLGSIQIKELYLYLKSKFRPLTKKVRRPKDEVIEKNMLEALLLNRSRYSWKEGKGLYL